MKSTFLLRIEPKVKSKLQQIAEVERRSITSLILLLVDKKISEVEENATA